MPSLLPSIAITALVAVFVKLVVGFIKHARIKRQMPPGPPGLPFLGNILQFATGTFLWYRLANLKEHYGPIFSLDFAGQPVVVTSDFSVTADLTDRRSGIYSDRPRLVMASEIMSDDMLFTLTRYNDRWRNMRKACHERFNNHAVIDFQPMEEMYSRVLLSKLLRSPREWEEDVTFSMATVLLRLIYGFTPREVQSRHEIVQKIDDFIYRLANVSKPGKFLVDFFPSMLYLPRWAAPWKVYGENCLRNDTEFFVGLLNEARTRTESVAGRAFCQNLLDAEARGDMKEVEVAWLAGMMYAAGMETSATTIITFILAMVLYPDVMHRAQQQIDGVVGNDRLPTFADYDDLPYIQAMVREVLRWRPPAPLALPKRCMQDNWYSGYFIPEGTMILENVWAMNHDPKYFPEPDVFRPERHLDSDGKLVSLVPDTHGYSHGSFGSGRRICVGKDFAMQTLFINFAVILWGINIGPALDEHGKPIMPSADDLVDKGVVVRPLPFPCSFKPRSSRTQHVLDAALEEAYATWDFV